MPEPTLNNPLPPAELCRRNGWGVGTRLVGDEGRGPTTIEITAIGERKILAREIKPDSWGEMMWVLRDREWTLAPAPPAGL